MSPNPAVLRSGKREDRKLHHVEALDQPVEDTQFGRMDHIFRIVQDHRLEARAGRALLARQGIPQMIEAIGLGGRRSEEHTSELQSLMRISYAVFCLKKKTNKTRMKQE